MDGQVFRLSFGRMASWSVRLLAVCGGVALVLSLLFSVPVFFLARMPMELFLSPLMLGVLPVILLLTLFTPMVLLICLLISWFLRYEVNALGLVQAFGPVRNEMDWLQIREIERTMPLKLSLVRVFVHKRDLPVTLFTGFLETPEAFQVAVEAYAPQNHPMRHSTRQAGLSSDISGTNSPSFQALLADAGKAQDKAREFPDE